MQSLVAEYKYKYEKQNRAGFEMPSWFDLMTLDATGPEDEAGIKSASALVSFCFGLVPSRGKVCN